MDEKQAEEEAKVQNQRYQVLQKVWVDNRVENGKVGWKSPKEQLDLSGFYSHT